MVKEITFFCWRKERHCRVTPNSSKNYVAGTLTHTMLRYQLTKANSITLRVKQSFAIL